MQVCAQAEIIPNTIYAVTPKHLSASELKQNSNIELIVIESGAFSSDLCMKEGDKLDVKLIEYIEPKRGKRNGYYKIEFKGIGGITISGKMRVSEPQDMQSIAKKAGITITGHILKVPGFSQAIAVSKGLINPAENKNRLQSAGENLYQSTPLTYVEKGKDFEVEEDGIVILKIKENN